MIQVRELTKSYGPHLAIDHLNFSVKKGEVVGFLGPNGAGKSTTMKIITGYMAPTSGSVHVAGVDVFANPIEVKKRIGYLPETPPVYFDMYVKDYLAFVAELKGLEKTKIKSHVDRALEKTDLGGVARRMIGNLSKGFKQRVGIAQALVTDPEILILDEPTVGLDPQQVASVRGLIKSLAGEHTIVLSTHILPEVQASCSRIIIINSGKIVAEDSLEGLAKRVTGGQKVFIKVRRPTPEFVASIQNLEGVLAVHAASENSGGIEVEATRQEDFIEELAAHAVQKGVGLLELRAASSNLEEIFLSLTQNTGKANGTTGVTI